jgi:hypothetical protein
MQKHAKNTKHSQKLRELIPFSSSVNRDEYRCGVFRVKIPNSGNNINRKLDAH